jgi:hypothetical protein
MPASKILLTIKTDSKEEETEVLTAFLTRLQYSPTSITPTESPDFEILLNESAIGIEITKYYSDFTKKGSKTQQKISEWKNFAEKLKAKLSAINTEFNYLYASIRFLNDGVNYKELLSNGYFNELLKLITEADLKRTEKKNISVLSDKYPLLSAYVNSIFLWNTYPENIYLWWDSGLQSGKVITNPVAIQTIVDKKNIASKKYKQNCNQKWLIIYACGLGLHDIYNETQTNLFRQGPVLAIKSEELQPNLPPKISSPYFSHILLWDRFMEKIFLLYPYHKKIFDYGEGKIWINHLPLKQQNVMSKKIILIACVSKKGDKKAKAKDLYTSQLFKSSLAYANKQKPDKIYILSALHHLLDPDEVIEPYNVTLSYVPKEKRNPELKILNPKEKKEWGCRVIEQLSKLADLKNDVFIVLAGNEYIKPIKESISHLSNPLKSLRQGEKVKFLNKNSL